MTINVAVHNEAQKIRMRAYLSNNKKTGSLFNTFDYAVKKTRVRQKCLECGGFLSGSRGRYYCKECDIAYEFSDSKLRCGNGKLVQVDITAD